MAFITLYSASIYQSANNIVPITASDDRGISTNTITGSFNRTATGSYMFVSSGSFTGASGSYTGSIAFKITQFPTSSSFSSSIFMYNVATNRNAIYTQVYSNYFSANPTLSDNALTTGLYGIEIGIQTLD